MPAAPHMRLPDQSVVETAPSVRTQWAGRALDVDDDVIQPGSHAVDFILDDSRTALSTRSHE